MFLQSSRTYFIIWPRDYETTSQNNVLLGHVLQLNGSIFNFPGDRILKDTSRSPHRNHLILSYASFGSYVQCTCFFNHSLSPVPFIQIALHCTLLMSMWTICIALNPRPQFLTRHNHPPIYMPFKFATRLKRLLLCHFSPSTEPLSSKYPTTRDNCFISLLSML